MSRKIEVPGQVIEIVNILMEEGFEAYPVGGCVRDFLLDKEPADWDITTSAEPNVVMKIFGAREGYKAIGTGLKHGTVTVVNGRVPYEITTFRTEGAYKDHRRPDTVEFTNSIVEDLRRRDFTVNAMAYITKEDVIDPFGGEIDLNKGVIRCVGNPNERFNEDALRILRAVRFASQLEFEIEENTHNSLLELRNTLNYIANERIKVEMEKLLMGAGAGRILADYVEVIGVFIPEVLPMVDFDQKNEHHSFDVWTHTRLVVGNSPFDVIGRWAALFHDIGKPDCFFIGDDGQGHFYGHNSKSAEMANEIMKRLKFDRDARERIVKLVKYHDTPLPTETKYLKRYLNKLGEEDFFRLVNLVRADNLGQSDKYRFRQKKYDEIVAKANEILKEEECFNLKNLMVDGNDMLALGFEGPEIGRVLNLLLEKVMDEDVENTKQELIEEAKKISLDESM